MALVGDDAFFAPALVSVLPVLVLPVFPVEPPPPVLALFFVAACELLPEVVVAVSLVVAHEVTNATPITATMHARRDFFIGVVCR